MPASQEQPRPINSITRRDYLNSALTNVPQTSEKVVAEYVSNVGENLLIERIKRAPDLFILTVTGQSGQTTNGYGGDKRKPNSLAFVLTDGRKDPGAGT